MKKTKFNVIDIFIIMIILLVMLLSYKLFYMKKIVSSPSKQEKVLITFETIESPYYSVENIKVGDKVADENRTIKFGEVCKEILINDCFLPLETKDGEFKLASKPEYKTADITVLCDGIIGDYGVIVDSKNYGIGHSMVLRVGLSKLYVRIKNIELAQ